MPSGATSTPQVVESKIAAYLGGVSVLRAGAAGLSAAQLKRRCSPGTWSIQEVVLHHVDCELSATHRMRRIAAEELPLLAAFDEDALIDKFDNAAMDCAEALDLVEANRKFTARWLRSLAPEVFTRVGIHTERGKMTLEEVLDIYTWHIGHHDAFVQGKRKTMGV